MPTKVMPITETVFMDEWAILLYETNGPAADSHSVRRYRHILVVRNDAPAEYVEDMGPACEFGDEVCIPGGVAEGGKFVSVERVGDLIEYADALKRRPFIGNDIVQADLIGGYLDAMEQRLRVQNGERP